MVCDPKQIYELRALYYALYINQKDILEKKRKKAEEQAQRKSSIQATPKKAAEQEEVQPEAPEMVFTADTFIDENFAEAVKTLTEFQTIMDEEQKKWEESGKTLNPEVATSITRKLRKFYNATRQVPVTLVFIIMDLGSRYLESGYLGAWNKVQVLLCRTSLGHYRLSYVFTHSDFVALYKRVAAHDVKTAIIILAVLI